MKLKDFLAEFEQSPFDKVEMARTIVLLLDRDDGPIATQLYDAAKDLIDVEDAFEIAMNQADLSLG